MTARIAGWLRKVAEWLDPAPKRSAAVVVLTVPQDVLFKRAEALVRHQELTRPGAGWGESKRHQVFARLIKEFPERSKRSIALAIEAVQE